MARFTRITVNFLLVVATTIQPAMVRAFEGSCHADCCQQLVCQGCDCCDVEPPDGRHGCCSGHSDVRSSTENDSCCGHGSAEEPGIMSTSQADSFVDHESADGVVADKARPRCADVHPATFTNSPPLVSGCHCLHAPEAPYAPEPRWPANEVRDLLSLDFASGVIAEPTLQLPTVTSVAEDPPHAILHFAQIEFCVWRL